MQAQNKYAKYFAVKNIELDWYEPIKGEDFLETNTGDLYVYGKLGKKGIFVCKLNKKGKVIWSLLFKDVKLYDWNDSRTHYSVNKRFQKPIYFDENSKHLFIRLPKLKKMPTYSGYEQEYEHTALVKIDENGNIIWSKEIIHSRNEYQNGKPIEKKFDVPIFLEDMLGLKDELLLSGVCSDHSDPRMFIKINHDGNVIWAKDVNINPSGYWGGAYYTKVWDDSTLLNFRYCYKTGSVSPVGEGPGPVSYRINGITVNTFDMDLNILDVKSYQEHRQFHKGNRFPQNVHLLSDTAILAETHHGFYYMNRHLDIGWNMENAGIINIGDNDIFLFSGKHRATTHRNLDSDFYNVLNLAFTGKPKKHHLLFKEGKFPYLNYRKVVFNQKNSTALDIYYEKDKPNSIIVYKNFNLLKYVKPADINDRFLHKIIMWKCYFCIPCKIYFPGDPEFTYGPENTAAIEQSIKDETKNIRIIEHDLQAMPIEIKTKKLRKKYIK